MIASTRRVLTAAQLDTFHVQGHLTVDGVFPPEAMDRALEACDRLVYGMDFATWSRRVLDGEPLPLRGEGVAESFATGVDELDDLVRNETYLDIIGDLLGSHDIHSIDGHLFVRAGPIDRRHPEHPWEGFHLDRPSGTFLPPHPEPGRYDYVGSGIFLHDVDADCAPTAVIPGSHRLIPHILPRLASEGIFHPQGAFTDIRRVPEFAPLQRMTGRKGSVNVNLTTLVHAAVPFADRRRQRAFWTMSFGRQENLRTQRLGNAFSYARRAHTIPLWERANPRVRAVFGWPMPGDPYYTPETLALLALWYPRMDLAPYRAAIA
jgi:hypothetical protein